MSVELLKFTRRALEKGASREEIGAALRAAGWSEPDVRAATGAYAPVTFPVPVPRPRPYLSAQEFFTYAVFFTAIYTSAFNLGALVFNLIDLWLPDVSRRTVMGVPMGPVVTDKDLLLDQVRSHVAALIVAYPLFLFMQRLIRRGLAADPKRKSRPRKWLTYLTLFFAASALIGDVSALVYNALGGDLRTRLLLQLGTVAVIAGGALSYFLWDIRQDERP